jgi:hypothetical protein
MKKMFMLLTGLLMVLGFALPVQAIIVDNVDWSNSFLLQGSGLENPLVRVGFNPQPEPPAIPVQS